MPKKFPAEFKRDVVTVARRGDLSVAEVAVDFGVAEETVRRWIRQPGRKSRPFSANSGQP
jgi:transposase